MEAKTKRRAGAIARYTSIVAASMFVGACGIVGTALYSSKQEASPQPLVLDLLKTQIRKDILLGGSKAVLRYSAQIDTGSFTTIIPVQVAEEIGAVETGMTTEICSVFTNCERLKNVKVNVALSPGKLYQTDVLEEPKNSNILIGLGLLKALGAKIDTLTNEIEFAPRAQENSVAQTNLPYFVSASMTINNKDFVRSGSTQISNSGDLAVGLAPGYAFVLSLSRNEKTNMIYVNYATPLTAEKGTFILPRGFVQNNQNITMVFELNGGVVSAVLVNDRGLQIGVGRVGGFGGDFAFSNVMVKYSKESRITDAFK